MNSALLHRADRASLAKRLDRSAAATPPSRSLCTAATTADWLSERERAHPLSVRRVPFHELDDWSFAPDTGNLVHWTGRFFSVGGLEVHSDEGTVERWRQPILHQPEIGILGILAKEFDGVLHFLMQAKMEPGNPRLLQISPTVQATRSNFDQVHRGSAVRYLEHFIEPRRGRVLADALQSEQGSWFYRKANRNMVVETTDHVEVAGDFRWFTLGQLGELLRTDETVNMCSRTVLACLPRGTSAAESLLTDTGLRSWYTAERTRRNVVVRRLPLTMTTGWCRRPDQLVRPDGRYFRIVGVKVEAGSREVTGWSQPLLEPSGTGVVAFLVRRIGGRVHLLAHARAEAGFAGSVEVGPTVQAAPVNWGHLSAADRPHLLDTVLGADPERIVYQAVHSEEGGRFLNARNRYMFVQCDPATVPDEPPQGFAWATPGQLTDLAAHGHYLNVQARSLLALITAGAIDLETVD
ncbi:NDP-hexose 2,3-dehydratase family protein [Nocardiopsis halophila]|uniref:NDP-hexose 2,3-dehydratase family protein n=1 Tax=Nocardiopsis halophila TaxID=141692 RepID=UPI000345B7DB|nr:NDP-hexose 2,3-dehydratase family protein [Nocardiopsis halophila]